MMNSGVRRIAEAWVERDADNTDLERRLAPLPKRWPRYAPQVRADWLAVGLALRDAAAAGRDVPRTRVGCVACGAEGAHAENRAYFSDYLAGGRLLGRSALFIHTLPTSSAAECALHFGLGGPLLYALPEDGCPVGALELAGAALRQSGVELMLVLLREVRGARCLALASIP
jgi:hypothetical protein